MKTMDENTTTLPDDQEILEAVASAFAQAGFRENWVDYLPSYIDSEDRYASDNWYIGTLDDGRTIWLTREDREGADRYGIVAPEPVN